MALSPEELKYVLDNAPVRSDGRAVAKLTQEERMQAFGLAKLRFTHGVIAQLFGVNKATIGHMVRPTSRHYVDIRAEYEKQGHEDFIARWITLNVLEQAKGLQAKIAQQPESREAQAYTRNPKADKRAGEHNYRGVTFKVLWHDRGVEATTGWIAIKPDDYDHPMPYGYDLVFATSTLCYQQTCKNIDSDGMIY